MSGPRTAVITGASSGIGEATALRLASSGCEMVLVGRRAAELDRVAERVRERGGTAHSVNVDLTKPGAVDEVFAASAKNLGDVDVLICCAAMVRTGLLHDTEVTSWSRQLHLNVSVPFELARHYLVSMRARRRGWIVTIGSAVGLTPVEGSGAYGVSKAALHHLTELLHRENRDHGVHVHAVAPGWVSTGLAADPTSLGVAPEHLLTSDDVADTVAWLLDRPARVSVGPVILVEPRHSRADAAPAMTAHAYQTSRKVNTTPETPR